MRMTEQDVRQDENAKYFIDLSHIETPLPEVEDLTDYKDLNNILYRDLTKEEIKQVVEFVLRLLEKRDEQV